MVSQEPAKLSYLLWIVWVRIPVSPPYAVCPGGEEAVLKIVGCKRLAGSNPVHSAIYVESKPSSFFDMGVIDVLTLTVLAAFNVFI